MSITDVLSMTLISVLCWSRHTMIPLETTNGMKKKQRYNKSLRGGRFLVFCQAYCLLSIILRYFVCLHLLFERFGCKFSVLSEYDTALESHAKLR